MVKVMIITDDKGTSYAYAHAPVGQEVEVVRVEYHQDGPFEDNDGDRCFINRMPCMPVDPSEIEEFETILEENS